MIATLLIISLSLNIVLGYKYIKEKNTRIEFVYRNWETCARLETLIKRNKQIESIVNNIQKPHAHKENRTTVSDSSDYRRS